MRPYRTARLILAVFVVVGLSMLPLVASAHPLGNFTVNRYSRLDVSAERIDIAYILDIAEIPTHTERARIDANRDDKIDAAEETAYLATLANEIRSGLTLTVDDQPADPEIVASRLEFGEGQAGLPLLRVELEFAAPVSGPTRIDYTDANYEGRLGWREIIVRPAEGVNLLESSVPQQDQSNELRAYPDDLLQNPPTVSHAAARFEPGTGASLAAVSAGAQGNAAVNLTREPFADLIAIPVLGVNAVALALLGAFGWGALHALSPGHGKSIVAAYLVGSRGTVAHAAFLGLTTTITHTAGVFALGLLTLVASNYIVPETLFPYLSLLSGLLVVGIGLTTGWNRLRGLLPHAQRGEHDHHEHDHARDHAHDHDHPHPHDHEHDHVHDHGHDHGPQGHSHIPPGADGSAVTWRSLLALGISGGLLPCPSALVVMLGAIALQRVAFGLLLIVVFSLGLASVLTAIGIAFVHAGRLFERIPHQGRLLRLAPLAGAAFITVAGFGVAYAAILQTGLLT